MNKIKIIFLLTLTIISTKVISQTTKTYNGEFQNGIAKYQYFENQNDERIYNGTFEYKSGSIQLSGFFKNNLKDSTWISKELDGGKLVTKTILNYKNGQIDGTQTYVNNSIDENSKAKIITERKITIKDAKFNGNITMKISKNGIPFANYNFLINPNGFVDSLNYFVKNKNKTINIKCTYSNGLLVYRFIQNIPTGEIISKFDIQKDIEILKKNFTTNNCVFQYNNKEYARTNFKIKVKEFNNEEAENDVDENGNIQFPNEECTSKIISVRELFESKGRFYNFLTLNEDLEGQDENEIDIENKFKEEVRFWISEFDGFNLSNGDNNFDKGNKTEILLPYSELNISN